MSITETETKNLEEQIDDLLNNLSNEKREKIKNTIINDKFKRFKIGQFSFFDDVLSYVDYGLILNKKGQIQTYSQESAPCLAIDPIKTPANLSEYKQKCKDPSYDLRYFPTIQFFKDRLTKISQ